MEIAKENNAVFVCKNPEAMKVKALAYNISDLAIMSYNEFIHSYDPDITTYVVDELEDFVKDIFTSGPQLIGYTLSNN